MNIFCFATGPLDTNTYILYSQKTKEAVIIDPGFDSFKTLVKEVEKKGLTPTAIWLTHSHWDHIGNVSIVKERFNIPVYIHEEDRGNLEHPGSDRVPMMFDPFKGTKPDFILSDNLSLFALDHTFTVIHTPGHSPGSCCFYCLQEKLLISGDTIFKHGIGSISLATGQPDRMRSSLVKLSLLPPDTVIYPGHGPKTTMKEEQWRQKGVAL